MRSDTGTLITALRILSRDIHCEDGVATAAIAEAADRLDELDGTCRWRYENLTECEARVIQRDEEIIRLKNQIEQLRDEAADAKKWAMSERGQRWAAPTPLTDAEREAVEQAAGVCELDATDERCLNIAAALRGLLERTKGGER